MKHKFLKILGILFVLIFAVALMQTTAFALTDGDYVYTDYYSGEETSHYTGPGGDVVIPSTLGGKPVLSIGAGTFGNNNITSITIPSTVTNIKSDAFIYCTSLSNIYFMGTSAQWDAITKGNDWSHGCPCGDTVHIVYTYTVEDNKATITGYDGPGGDVVIPSTLGGYPVTAIGDNAFSSEGITSVTFPSTLISIGYGAFTYNHMTSLTFPASLTSIGEKAFYKCEDIETVTFSTAAITIGNDAFKSCPKIARVDVPDADTWSSITFGNNASNPLNVGPRYDVLYIGGKLITPTEVSAWDDLIDVCKVGGCFILTADISTDDFGYSIKIPADTNVTLDLNGHIIDRGLSAPSWDGNAIRVQGGNLTILDSDPTAAHETPVTYTDPIKNKTVTVLGGVITGGYTDQYGGGVSVESGTFNMYGGTVCGNSSGEKGMFATEAVGGGVYIQNGTFNMYGGTIANNTAVNKSFGNTQGKGGGVFAANGIFNMYGGLIHGNTAGVNGGGVHIGYNGGFNLYSGTIFGNTAPTGADVYNNGSTVAPDLETITLISGEEYVFADIKIYGEAGSENGEYILTPESNTDFIKSCISAYTYTVSDGKATVTYCFGRGGDIVIPSTLGGYPVTAIDDYAFVSRTDLTSVTIPEGVTTIGDSAFIGCENLKTVTFPSTLMSIKHAAFTNCPSLQSVTIPEGVTSIGISAFLSCTALESVTIPSTVTSIGVQAFNGCTSLSDIYYVGSVTQWNGVAKGDLWNYNCPCGDNIHCLFDYTVSDGKVTITNYFGTDSEVVIPSKLGGNPVTAIGDNAFKNNNNITSVTIPEGVTTIGENAFYGCENLETVILPSTLEVVGGGAFINCSKINRVDVADIAKWCAVKFYDNTSNPFTLGNNFNKLYVDGQKISDLVIPEGVTSIGSMAFFGCMGLKSVTLPSTLNSIENFAFSYCTGIKSITIPDGVTTIGVNAFSNCTGIKSITIPAGVTSIRQGAFLGCTSLSNIYFMGTSAQWTAVSKGKDWNEDCPCGDNVHIVYSYTVDDGKATLTAYDGLGGDVVIPSTLDGYPVVAIGDNAFASKTNVTAVTIPEGVTSIGNGSFWKCSNLEAVTLPSTLESVGMIAFSDCVKLSAVNVADIAAWCAVSFANFSSNPLARGATYDKLYVGGELIHELVIPEGVTGIGDYAFYRCAGLTSVTFPSTLVTIGDYAFNECTLLESAIMPESLKNIGEYAFYKSETSKLVMQYLGTINGWHEVTKGNNWSDYGQPNRMKYAYQYILSDGKATITVYDGLGGDVVIPSTLDGYPVTAIGNNAFKDKTNVTAVTIPEGVTAIGKNAFYNCSDLETVTLPSTLESVGEDAFYGCNKISAVNVADIAAWCAVEFAGVSSNPLYAGDEHDKLYVGGKLIHELVIPEGVTSIGDLAFSFCQGLTSVTLPSTVQSIGGGAFDCCKSLQSVTVPEGVTSIGESAFESCASLKSISIPEGVTSIAQYTFYGCFSLESVTILSSETSIGNQAFYGCTSLDDIYYYGTAAEWDALPKGNQWSLATPENMKIHFMCTVTVSSSSDKTGSAAGGGVYEIGDPVAVTATPAEHYVFVNWTSGTDVVSTDPTYEFTPTGNTELVANFALEKFTVTFKNEDDSVLWSGDFEYGTMPVYGGETPTKENDGDIEFTFCNWYPKLETVTKEETYYVLFGIETDQVCDECGKTLYCYPSVSDKYYHYAFCFNDECVNFAGLPVKYQSHYGTEPTCTHLSVCEFCGVAFGELDPDNHDWDDGVVAVEPTCTTDGEMLYTCKYDNSHTRTEAIPAKGHVDGEPVIENVAAPTCLTEGSYDLVTYCTVCGAETSRREVRQDPLGHSFGDWTVTKPATCTEKGEETRVCANNPSHKETREIAALGHDFGEWFVTVEPTENEEGLETRVCSICGAEESQSIAKLSHKHKLVHYPAVEPTETSEGQKEYYVCSGCGKWFEDAEGKKEITDRASVVIPALGKTEPIAYEFKVEPETEWVRGSGKDFVLTSMADFSKFIGAKVDGNFLDKSFFTAEEGSTKVAFKSEYLETLSAGEHTLTVVSEDGEASASVNIIADPVSPDTPTETNPSPVIWIIIALVVAAVAAAAVVVVIIVKKKKK